MDMQIERQRDGNYQDHKQHTPVNNGTESDSASHCSIADPCSGVHCGDNGACSGGACTCESPAYTGDRCQEFGDPTTHETETSQPFWFISASLDEPHCSDGG